MVLISVSRVSAMVLPAATNRALTVSAEQDNLTQAADEHIAACKKSRRERVLADKCGYSLENCFQSQCNYHALQQTPLNWLLFNSRIPHLHIA